MADIVFKFPSNSQIDNIAALQYLRLQTMQCEAERINLDLSSIQVFTPFTACFLAALTDELRNNGKKGHLILPLRSNARNQFDYLGVHSHFSGQSRRESMAVPTAPLVHRFEEDYDVAFTVARLVRGTHDMSNSFFHLLTLCLKELLQNAFQHAESKSGVYLCAYAVRTRRLVRLCVMDLGIGIRRHLTRNPKYKGLTSDESALVIAVTAGTSGVIN